MITEFTHFIDSNNIAIKESKTLLAVSGGIDSVVMVYLFNHLKLDFGIAHCNFELRGEESDTDERFVKELALSLNCPFHTTKFSTTKYAKTQGVSIQMAARELRYAWFEQIKNEFEYKLVATAHHKGDVVETILYNLTKGTGLDGLHGIRAKVNSIIRPMLFASRAEIEKYANTHNIKWREDSSNTSLKYARNKIRHQVLPLLEELNPKVERSIYATSERLSEIEKFINFNVAEYSDKNVEIKDGGIFIRFEPLFKIPGYGYLLFELLKPFGFTYAQSVKIKSGLSGMSGKLFYSKSHVLNIDRGYLIVSEITFNDGQTMITELNDEYSFKSKSISTKTIEKEGYEIPITNKVLAIDKGKLSFPLKIRAWQTGDVFYPLGMKGKKKLSDFMIDAKIPVNLKKEVGVILSGSKIVGILEHRLDERFKITKDTQQIFEISCS